MTPVLAVENYRLEYASGGKLLRALDDVSLAIGPGEVLGLVGESGSGKTSLAAAIMRLLPANAREGGGAIRLKGEDLRGFRGRWLRAVRGKRIAMVFQDPATALNPTLTLGRQVSEVLETHRGLSPKEARAEAIAMLGHVEISDPEALFSRYPHEASGGEKQRVVIATAFACHPDLVLLDEPTTALDVLTGARILDLFRRLRAEIGMAGLYISHDLALVSQIADRVAVIRSGRILEEQPAVSVFRAPKHPYTRLLAEAVPRSDRRLTKDGAGEVQLIALDSVSVRYGRPGLFRSRTTVGAEGVSFAVREREILGVMGEFGSGKSSLARALAGLVPFGGQIHFSGRTIAEPGEMDRAYRRAVQIVFQNPDSSLNPRQRVREILARPLHLFGGDVAQIPRLLEEVRLPPGHAARFPHELSGGEKQRVAIARAFAVRPRFVICDEITASLDVSVAASVIQLLLALRAAHGTAYLFITHDLNRLVEIAHRVAVMRSGRLVDLCPVTSLGGDQAHPYTRQLIAASSPSVSQ